MSHKRADGCYCKKCGASVNPNDEKCPKGHILKEVGKHFVVSAEEKIGISAEAKIEITREEENILKRIANRVRESMGADSLTIKLPFIDITFDKHEQDTTA